MPSLAKLLADHGSLLVLDAASTTVQAGLLSPAADPVWRSIAGEAGSTLFGAVQEVLGARQLTIDQIGAFAYCEGPGSMLGVRTVAMAIRTWNALLRRPVYAYESLSLAGWGEWKSREPRAFTMISDARRDSWHCRAIGADGRPADLERRASSDLPAGELVTPQNFRAWTKLPLPAGTCRYDVGRLFQSAREIDLWQATDAPDAFQPEAPSYRRWSAQVHSAASAPVR